jgi:hypothetical protein
MKRNKDVIKAFRKEICLKTKSIKSKKLYNRKNFKIEIK